MKAIIAIALSMFIYTVSAAESPLEPLREIIRQTHELQNQRLAEERRWKVEKKQLQIRLENLIQAVTDSENEEKILIQKIAALKADKGELQKKLKARKAVIAAEEKLLSAHFSSLNKSHDLLPDTLKSIIGSEFDSLEDSFKDADLPLPARIAACRNYASALLRLQQGTHIVRHPINMDGKANEFHVLYTGTLCGYFYTADYKTCGTLTLVGDKWTSKRDNSLSMAIRTSIEQLQKQGKPRLTALPLPGASK